MPSVLPWQAVHRRLADEIAGGAYPVGTLLPAQAALAERFGVSQTVVRRAQERLAWEGLIRADHGRGVVVLAERPQRPAGLEDRVAWLETQVAELAEQVQAIHDAGSPSAVAGGPAGG